MWFCLSLMLIENAAGKELTSNELTSIVFTEDKAGQFIPTGGASDPFAAIGQILSLETKHLIALGLGIAVGAAIIAPELKVGEITGIVIGVIVGDLLYRSTLAPPAKKHDSWFDNLF